MQSNPRSFSRKLAFAASCSRVSCVAASLIFAGSLMGQADLTPPAPAPAPAAAVGEAPANNDSQQGNRRQRDRQNFNPEEMRAQMMNRMKEVLEVTDDAEWALIMERVTKVQEAQRAGGGGFGGRGGMLMMGRMFGGPGGQQQGGNNQAGRANRPGGMQASPETEALQIAIQNKATETEIKERLARFRQIRKDNEEKISKAQEELRAVLNVRQEAVAVLFGLLN